MEFQFEGEVIEWRGPAPFLFVQVPDDVATSIRGVSRQLTYGWGVIPASVVIGATQFTTAIFPRNGSYLVPVKVAVQRSESVGLGDLVGVHLTLGSQ